MMFLLSKNDISQCLPIEKVRLGVVMLNVLSG